MKIESRQNIKGAIRTIVLFGNKRYIRLQKNKFNGLDEGPIVEWKREKTNHLVKADKYRLLEDKFISVDTTAKKTLGYTQTSVGPAKIVSSGSTSFYDFKSSTLCLEDITKKKRIDDGIKTHLKLGSILPAVKFYREQTGEGLKESKDYVDKINVVYLAEKKWDNGITPTMEQNSREQNSLLRSSSSFNSTMDRNSFLKEVKSVYVGNNALQTVKLIKDKMGWGLYDSKIFFDLYIK